MTSCALTDHGWLAGTVEFYKEMRSHKIKPLLGLEAYITEDEDGKESDLTRDNMHMILIAKDIIGYRKLLELNTNAGLHNFYYKPRIWKGHLQQLAGHVVATSACLGGVISKKLEFKKDDYGRAIEIIDPENIGLKDIEYYAQLFGDDFYLELQAWDNGDHFQPLFNQYLLKHGLNMKLPFVITADAHYLKKGDEKLHEMLMAMQMKMTLEQYLESGELQYGPHFYVKTPEEMLEGAKNLNCEEAYYNTKAIADKCNVELELGTLYPPVFNIKEADDYQDFLGWKKGRVQVSECTHQ